jgi:hypothetical protein
MSRIVGITLLFLSLAGLVQAITGVPEIDASSGTMALTVLAGALLVIRGRGKK